MDVSALQQGGATHPLASSPVHGHLFSRTPELHSTGRTEGTSTGPALVLLTIVQPKWRLRIPEIKQEEKKMLCLLGVGR